MGEWRKRHNDEQCNLYIRSDIVKEIKRKRLEWASHMWRKSEAMIKTVLQGGKDL